MGAPLRVVIDTNILVRGSIERSIPHNNIMSLMLLRQHYLLLDFNGRLRKQYHDNVGFDIYFQKWYKELQTKKRLQWFNGCPGAKLKEELRKRNLHDKVDQIIVALSLNGDKYVITEDSDFGKGDSPKAAQQRILLEYLVNDLNLTVHDACEARAKL